MPYFVAWSCIECDLIERTSEFVPEISHEHNGKIIQLKKLHDLLQPRGFNHRKGQVFACTYCGKEFYLKQSLIDRSNIKFCSHKHHILFMKKNAFRQNCKVCGKVFYCQPCQIEYRHRETCSNECRAIMHSRKAEEKRIKNGFTKHQVDRCLRASKKATEWRTAVFKRDDYACQICKTRGGYLEAHHIFPFAYYPELRFDVSNGTTLCRKCHDKTKLSFQEMRLIHAAAISNQTT